MSKRFAFLEVGLWLGVMTAFIHIKEVMGQSLLAPGILWSSSTFRFSALQVQEDDKITKCKQHTSMQMHDRKNENITHSFP
jgi:hypothetical protein